MPPGAKLLPIFTKTFMPKGAIPCRVFLQVEHHSVKFIVLFYKFNQKNSNQLKIVTEMA